MKKIILASASPRRAALLAQAGIGFEVLKVDYTGVEAPASCCAGDAARFAAESASAKLERARDGLGPEPAILVCADTVVDAGGEVFGKPADAEDARRMLRALSGRAHRVHTGVAACEIPGGAAALFVETTEVEFHELDEELIETYIATGEPYDKAGAYGIQERAAVFVKRVSGCYANVVGLPVAGLMKMIEDKFGVSAAEHWSEHERCRS